MLGKLTAVVSLALLSIPVHSGDLPPDAVRQISEAPQARLRRHLKEYHAFARYIEDWLAKVERVGNANYPEPARREGIYGSLTLTVSIRADGSVEAIEIDRSSGSEVLDAAAIRIVKLAAPFASFSDEMSQKADILSITRTWTFTRSDQLVGTD